MKSSLLNRQLKRLNLDENSCPESVELWKQFLECIDSAYILDEEGRYLTERALDISSKEMAERYEALSNEIKKREEVANSLQENLTQHEALLDALPDIMFRYNTEGHIIDLRMNGNHDAGPFSAHDIGKSLQDLLSEDVVQQFLLSGKRAIEENTVESLEFEIEKDSSILYFEARVTASGFTKLTAIVRNLTQKIKAEKEKEEILVQLSQSAKLASVGTLAAGIAHELNNPLAAIKGFSQLMMTRNLTAEKVKELSEKMVKTANRMGKIIDHLRVFSRKNREEDWVNVNFNRVIEDAFIFLSGPLQDASIEWKLDLEGHHPIFGDPNQLESIVQNFLTNSRDAFQSHPEIKKRFIKISTSSTSGVFEFHYEDNAGGMSKEVSDRIFEPFYTTKKIGSGTGLGLSICHGIIKQHQGEVNVISDLGKGTQFHIAFPVSENKGAKNSDESHFESKVPAYIVKENRILVIDDEELICELFESIFKDLYQVTSVTDSKKALELISSNSYNLVISDMKMPDFSGLDVIEHVRKVSPKSKIAIMSGNVGEDVQNILHLGADTYISKPFSNEELMRSINKLLSN